MLFDELFKIERHFKMFVDELFKIERPLNMFLDERLAGRTSRRLQGSDHGDHAEMIHVTPHALIMKITPRFPDTARSQHCDRGLRDGRHAAAGTGLLAEMAKTQRISTPWLATLRSAHTESAS